jgi:hypothetical protein
MSTVSLPTDLITPIVKHLRADSATLRSTALVSSDWLEISRKQLFRRFTIPRNDDDDVDVNEEPFAELRSITNAAMIAGVRLVWLLLHPKFADYVTELEVHTKDMGGVHMTTGSPGLGTFLLLSGCMDLHESIFHNIQIIHMVDEGYRMGYQMWLHSLSQGFPHLQLLDIHIHPRMSVMIGGFYRFTGLRNLSIICTEISGAQDLLQSLAMGNPRSTIETISFVLLNDITALGLCLTITNLSYFKNLREANVCITLDKNAKVSLVRNKGSQMSQHVSKRARDTMKGVIRAPFADTPDAYGTLHTLTLTLLGDDTCVPLLIFLLYGARLSALRELTVFIDMTPCIAAGASSQVDFKPFSITKRNQNNAFRPGSTIKSKHGALPSTCQPILTPELVQTLKAIDLVFKAPIGVNDISVYDSSDFITLLAGSDAMNTVAMSHERLTGRVHLVKE